MTDQVENQEVVDVPNPEGQENQEQNQTSPIEAKALELGWKPETEWSGDPDDFIDAKEFVRRKPLFDKIEAQNKRLKDTEKALIALKEHHNKVKETEYKRALDQLRLEKKAALEDGDADRLLEVDDAIAEVRAAQDSEKRANSQEAPTVHPDFLNWVEKNSWYAQDGELREAADVIGVTFKNKNPDTDPSDVLKHVENKIRKMFPDKFQNPKRSTPSSVESTHNNTPTRKVSDTFELTPDERRAMQTFVRQNVMSEKEYIAELKKVKGI